MNAHATEPLVRSQRQCDPARGRCLVELVQPHSISLDSDTGTPHARHTTARRSIPAAQRLLAGSVHQRFRAGRPAAVHRAVARGGDGAAWTAPAAVHRRADQPGRRRRDAAPPAGIGIGAGAAGAEHRRQPGTQRLRRHPQRRAGCAARAVAGGRRRRGPRRCAQAGDLQQPRRPARACRPGRAAPARGARPDGGASTQFLLRRAARAVRHHRDDAWLARRRDGNLIDPAPAARSGASGRARRFLHARAGAGRARRLAGRGKAGGSGLDGAGPEPAGRVRQRHRRQRRQGSMRCCSTSPRACAGCWPKPRKWHGRRARHSKRDALRSIVRRPASGRPVRASLACSGGCGRSPARSTAAGP